MNSTRQNRDGTLILLYGDASALPAELLEDTFTCRTVVATDSRVQLVLVPLAMPGAEVIWTDFRHSASIRSLRRAVLRISNLKRLVIVGGNDADWTAHSHLSVILTLLPGLLHTEGGELTLCVSESPSARSLQAFLDGIAPALAERNLRVNWRALQDA